MLEAILKILLLIIVIILFLRIIHDINMLITKIMAYNTWRKFHKNAIKNNATKINFDEAVSMLKDKHYYIYSDESLYNDVYHIIIGLHAIIIENKYYDMDYKNYSKTMGWANTELHPYSLNIRYYDSVYGHNSQTTIIGLCEKLNMECILSRVSKIYEKDNKIILYLDKEMFNAVMRFPMLLICIKYIYDNNILYIYESVKNDMLTYVERVSRELSDDNKISTIIICHIKGYIEKILFRLVSFIEKESE